MARWLPVAGGKDTPCGSWEGGGGIGPRLRVLELDCNLDCND
jgi:hypothetical protein